MTDPALDPNRTVTNDAVAGETVLPGQPQGPEGGAPQEAQPDLAENDLADELIDLDSGDSADVSGEEDEGGGTLESDDLTSIEGSDPAGG